MKCTNMVVLSLGLLSMSSCESSSANLGLFERGADVGQISLPGSTQFDAATKQYRITGSGVNMWGTEDAFYFVWRPVSGDLKLSARVGFERTGGHEHRKAGWMVRQSTDPDAAYIDAVVHGNGLICLQYRSEKGGETREIQSPIEAPATVRLERDADLFTLSVAKAGAVFQPVGSMTVMLSDAVCAGLAVCSHDATCRETAVFSDVDFENVGVVPEASRVLESTLEVIDVQTLERRIVHRVVDHLEAPNWSPDGKTVVFNSRGRLHVIPVTGGTPRQIESGSADNCNNDHGFSPDGQWLAISHNAPGTGSLIYVIPSTGGRPRQITQRGPSYWHGWSPDGRTLTYCAEQDGEFDVYTIGVGGGTETRLTTAPGLDDGPEYSPDGKYIYFNSVRSGLMKIWRMRPDGSQQEQVTSGADYADWFAHPSPDGKWLVFLSYDKSVEGHPANQQVMLRLMPAAGGEPRVIAHLFGGQGTINVPSWSPNSSQVAFVSYRLIAPVAAPR
ncbi:MAG: TolB family protein [Sedimentisphaerales bacterium]|nr:TolB family protein [Sedimentisphaerales bacterium]